MEHKSAAVPDHIVTIEALYFVKEAIHKWRALCTCGYTSEWSLSPRATERAAEVHREAVRR